MACGQPVARAAAARQGARSCRARADPDSVLPILVLQPDAAAAGLTPDQVPSAGAVRLVEPASRVAPTTRQGTRGRHAPRRVRAASGSSTSTAPSLAAAPQPRRRRSRCDVRCAVRQLAARRAPMSVTLAGADRRDGRHLARQREWPLRTRRPRRPRAPSAVAIITADMADARRTRARRPTARAAPDREPARRGMPLRTGSRRAAAGDEVEVVGQAPRFTSAWPMRTRSATEPDGRRPGVCVVRYFVDTGIPLPAVQVEIRRR